ncbi:MAG: ATP-binding protein [Pseudomonadota bacterium]|nr:MAG: ATP-binding protein [Pseudomonadota bacterium]
MSSTPQPPRKLLQERFSSQTGELKRIRTLVREAATTCGCSDDEIDCVVLAVNEACMNIIQHAYGHAPDGEIILEILNNQHELVFRLRDFGVKVDPCSVRSRDLEDIRPGGLGVHLMSQVMDAVEFLPPPDGTGNLLELRKTITAKRTD